ncbi:MAG: SPOR domain-containing protein [Polaribacter sp.]
MKTKITVFVFFLMIVACGKKEIKKEETTVVSPVKDSIVQVETPVVEIPKLIFMVQIAALKKENAVLQNIEGIHAFSENSLIKYRLGNFSTYKEAKNFKKSLLNTYPDAFIQALENDVPINIKQALKK